MLGSCIRMSMASFGATAAATMKYQNLRCETASNTSLMGNPSREILTWDVPAIHNDIQWQRVQQLKEAFRHCDLMQKFHSAEMKSSRVPIQRWDKYVDLLKQKAPSEDAKAKYDYWYLEDASSEMKVTLIAQPRGSELVFKLAGFQTIGEHVVYKHVEVTKQIEVVKKDVKSSPALRLVYGVFSCGLNEIWEQDAQHHRDKYEQEVATLTTDDVIMNQFVAQTFKGLFEANGVKVRIAE